MAAASEFWAAFKRSFAASRDWQSLLLGALTVVGVAAFGGPEWAAFGLGLVVVFVREKRP